MRSTDGEGDTLGTRDTSPVSASAVDPHRHVRPRADVEAFVDDLLQLVQAGLVTIEQAEDTAEPHVTLTPRGAAIATHLEDEP